MWEYLSLYAERNDATESFNVKHYPEPHNLTSEREALDELGAVGWELVAVVPAYGGGGTHVHHQLYLKRPRQARPAAEQSTQRFGP